MGELQKEFDYICALMQVDPNKPVDAMWEMFSYMGGCITEWEAEDEITRQINEKERQNSDD
jgi:hypothetical protein